MEWGSDAVADMIRACGVEYISLNPGASYRGLHDSLVNHLGNDRPAIVLCLHEEHAVAVAHGYAKVTGQPMAVALHSNVGLMHATMALYNAFCDRVPMLVLGGTGPWDAAQRRPWIDWIHTSADQAALVRPYVKWDDQPGSVSAAMESLARANLITRGYPSAPVYVCLDAAIQESELIDPVVMPDVDRHSCPPPPGPDRDGLEKVRALLQGAKRPVFLVGRVSRSVDAWSRRIELAELVEANVLTDLRAGSAFPTAHRLHVAPPSTFLLTPEGAETLRSADVILALDWVDLGGTLRQAFGSEKVTAKVISCTCDHVLHNGWSKDHGELPVTDVLVACHPDALVASLLDGLTNSEERSSPASIPRTPVARVTESGTADLDQRALTQSLRAALDDQTTCLVHVPLGWQSDAWDFDHPLAYLGKDGGGGLGSGPGMAVGAALGLRGSERLAVAVLGDGDYLMGATALWTAAQLKLPLLVVVANNGTYLNDEVHQERVARTRGRPIENRWVGQSITEPRPDLAALARSMGLTGYGPIKRTADLQPCLNEARETASQGPVVVDVHVAC